MTLSRRTFVAWAAGALPVAIVARSADALGAAWLANDEATLNALARAMLPSDLGAAGATKVARDFQAWIDGYAENAEINHGYGTSALRFSRPSPRVAWAAQLEALGSRLSAGKKFVDMSLDQRRAIIREELKNERIDRMPAVGTASHIALGLLAFYYGSSQAADLCYGSQIGRQNCRPLAANSRKPLPLAAPRAG
jgi:hypothetical protein